MVEVSPVKLLSDDCGWILLMISQYIGSGNGLVPSAITWANVDPALYRHMASLGHNEFSDNELLKVKSRFTLIKL